MNEDMDILLKLYDAVSTGEDVVHPNEYTEFALRLLNQKREPEYEIVDELVDVTSDIRNGFHYVSFHVRETGDTSVLVAVRSKSQDYYDGSLSREAARSVWDILIADGFIKE